MKRENVVRGWRWLLAPLVALVALTALAGCNAAQGNASPTQTPRPTQTPLPTVDPWVAYGLSVQGTHIVNAKGQAVTLLGAAHFSLEYSCKGDGHFTLNDFLAMRSWGMNTVRIPLSSAFWRNLDGQCPTYQATVEQDVANAEQLGLYVILDLQRSAPFSYATDAKDGGGQCPLPDAYDLAFWQDLASRYASDPRVLFDVFSEPNNISWNQWWNGGAILSNCYHYSSQATYTGISLPKLVAAVRAVAPRNIIIVSGVNWGYDISGITAARQLSQSNVLYGTHPWDHSNMLPSDWQRAFGNTAGQLPVIASEFGQYDCRTNYIAPEIQYFERLHISFVAWDWTIGGCNIPALLTRWDGTPTSPYGAYIQQQMLQAAKSNPPGF